MLPRLKASAGRGSTVKACNAALTRTLHASPALEQEAAPGPRSMPTISINEMMRRRQAGPSPMMQGPPPPNYRQPPPSNYGQPQPPPPSMSQQQQLLYQQQQWHQQQMIEQQRLAYQQQMAQQMQMQQPHPQVHQQQQQYRSPPPPNHMQPPQQFQQQPQYQQPPPPQARPGGPQQQHQHWGQQLPHQPQQGVRPPFPMPTQHAQQQMPRPPPPHPGQQQWQQMGPPQAQPKAPGYPFTQAAPPPPPRAFPQPPPQLRQMLNQQPFPGGQQARPPMPAPPQPQQIPRPPPFPMASAPPQRQQARPAQQIRLPPQSGPVQQQLRTQPPMQQQQQQLQQRQQQEQQLHQQMPQAPQRFQPPRSFAAKGFVGVVQQGLNLKEQASKPSPSYMMPRAQNQPPPASQTASASAVAAATMRRHGVERVESAAASRIAERLVGQTQRGPMTPAEAAAAAKARQAVGPQGRRTTNAGGPAGAMKTWQGQNRTPGMNRQRADPAKEAEMRFKKVMMKGTPGSRPNMQRQQQQRQGMNMRQAPNMARRAANANKRRMNEVPPPPKMEVQEYIPEEVTRESLMGNIPAMITTKAGARRIIEVAAGALNEHQVRTWSAASWRRLNTRRRRIRAAKVRGTGPPTLLINASLRRKGGVLRATSPMEPGKLVQEVKRLSLKNQSYSRADKVAVVETVEKKLTPPARSKAAATPTRPNLAQKRVRRAAILKRSRWWRPMLKTVEESWNTANTASGSGTLPKDSLIGIFNSRKQPSTLKDHLAAHKSKGSPLRKQTL